MESNSFVNFLVFIIMTYGIIKGIGRLNVSSTHYYPSSSNILEFLFLNK